MGAFKVAQENYCEFYTEGVWNEEKGKEKIGPYFTEERLEYIHRFYECLLNSSKMNELGRMYIQHSNLSVRKVVELYNQKREKGKQLNPDTGKSRIIACANKVNNSFTDSKYQNSKKNNLEWIMGFEHFNEYNDELIRILRDTEEQIEQFIEMFDTTSKEKKEMIAIKVPAYAKVRNLSEDRFDNFLEIIRPYSKREMENVEEALKQMREEVGYYNFLMTPGVKLTEVDKERRDILLRWLGTESGISKKDMNDNFIDF